MTDFRVINGQEDDEDRMQNELLTSNYAKRIINVGVNHTHYHYERYPLYAETIKEFEIRNDDVLVASFPKSGTTWLLELVWLLQNNMDYEGAKAPAASRSTFLEHCTFMNWDAIKADSNVDDPEYVKDSIEFARKQKCPRILKTHLSFCLLPEQIQNNAKKTKVIYILRNPMDVSISFCHHGRLLLGWKATPEEYAKIFIANKGPCGPYWTHVFEYFDQRNNLEILFIKYEDMKKNLTEIIHKVAAFLNKTVKEEQLPSLLNHLSFDSMKKNSSVNSEAVLAARKICKLNNEEGSFIRSGVVGKYKEELTPETIAKFKAWIKNNVNGTDYDDYFDFMSYTK